MHPRVTSPRIALLLVCLAVATDASAAAPAAASPPAAKSVAAPKPANAPKPAAAAKSAAAPKTAASGLPAGWKVAPTTYGEAPEPWRSYLTKAREADAIADPIQRCLAFPPFPGSNWPANLLPAHCEYAFGQKVTLDTVKQRLDANDVAGLEAIYRALQERHFSDTDFSEHIHGAIEIFNASYEAGAISKRWLEAAPDSPFAMAARAEFYRNMGWAARGGNWSQETPKEQMARMGEFHDKAVALYRQALAKEPRLMPAHAGLVDIGKNGTRDKDFDAAYRIDPACKVLISNRMISLEPRWGGSYQAMGAEELRLLQHLPRRPLLALSRVWPYDDVHDVLYAAKKYPESRDVLKPMVSVSSSPQVYDDIASALSNIDGSDRWELLAYLVESTRFRTGTAWLAQERGRLQLSQAHDPALAEASLAASIKLAPDDYYTHYLRGAALGRLGRIDEAEQEYQVAMQDKPDSANHRDALLELAHLMVYARRADKARKYAKQAVTEFPDNPSALLANAHAIGVGGSSIAPLRAAMEAFLAKADPKDPKYARAIEETRKDLAQLREFAKKEGVQ